MLLAQPSMLASVIHLSFVRIKLRITACATAHSRFLRVLSDFSASLCKSCHKFELLKTEFCAGQLSDLKQINFFFLKWTIPVVQCKVFLVSCHTPCYPASKLGIGSFLLPVSCEGVCCNGRDIPLSNALIVGFCLRRRSPVVAPNANVHKVHAKSSAIIFMEASCATLFPLQKGGSYPFQAGIGFTAEL